MVVCNFGRRALTKGLKLILRMSFVDRHKVTVTSVLESIVDYEIEEH